MGIGRRGALASAAVAALVILGGCHPFRPRLERAVNEAAAGVAGVRSAELTVGREAELRRLLSGTLFLEGTGAEAVAQFDAAMRAVITAIHDYSAEEREGTRRVGGVTARDAGGTTLDVTSLIDMPTKDTRGFPVDDSGLGDVIAADLYERYGLTL